MVALVASSLSLKPLKAHETDLISQLPVSGDPGGAQADTTALSHMTGLNRDQSLIAHFQVWRISLELHWLTPNTASLELISYWADNGLTQTQELHSICIKEVLDPGGVVWRWCALGRAKLVCECCGGRALATAHESLTSVWPERKELST